jgi:hypothetical protein
MRLVRAVAMHAEQITLLAIPLAGAAAVHPRAPVAILLAVALPAQAIRLFEWHSLTAREMKNVAIVRVVTVEAPPVLFVVLQHDVLVIVDGTTGAIGFEIRVTERARIDALRERRRRHLDVLSRASRRRLFPLSRGRLSIVASRDGDQSNGHDEYIQGSHTGSRTVRVRSSTTRCISRSHIA